MRPHVPQAAAYGLRPQAASAADVRGRPELVINRISAQRCAQGITLEVGQRNIQKRRPYAFRGRAFRTGGGIRSGNFFIH